MPEWLTTGQMIDRLRVGEVAEDKFGKYTAEFEKGNIQIYLVTETFGTIEKRRYGDALSRNILGLEWWILPKYVSFEEAMKALREGKGVRCEFKDDVGTDRVQELHMLHGGYLPLHVEAIRDGKWSIIEGDS